MQISILDLRPQFNSLKDEILKEIAEVCESQRFILGPKVEHFEAMMNDYCHTAATVGVTSGSDALIISLMAEDIGPGDEVIAPTFTFFATAGAIARVGATPVFADIDPVTFNLDPADFERKITPKTKAVIPVHLFGQCADMGKIMAIAKSHNLIVIEDACQSIGAEYNGQRAGSIGDYGAFSFFPTKNLGGFGDGGAVTTNSEERGKHLKRLRNHGQGSTYIHEEVGGNFRLDALQAAILAIKLPHLDSWTEARQHNAEEYRKLFSSSKIADRVILPGLADYPVRHIYNQFCIRIVGADRDKVKAQMAELGVGCMVYYPLPLHLQACFKNLGGKIGDMPVAETVAKDILALPIYPESTTEMRQYIVECFEKVLSGC